MQKRDLFLILWSVIAGIILGAVLTLSITGTAQVNGNRVPATNVKSGRVVTIPALAVQVADNVFSLGTAVVDGEVLEGYMIVDYRKGFEHRPRHNPPGGGNKGKKGEKCFAFISKGAKWKSEEPWLVNTANTEGLSSIFILSNLGLDIQKWENESSTNILGDGNITATPLVADTVSPDGMNEVYFGDVDSPGAIAVTIVWGRFSGKPDQREIVEWDQVYDQVDFDWTANGGIGKMDFENIATHELGHTVGMGHPEDTCTEETMYRLAVEDETKKRDLHTGDIAGIQELYK